jgi:PKD repeat protein
MLKKFNFSIRILPFVLVAFFMTNVFAAVSVTMMMKDNSSTGRNKSFTYIQNNVGSDTLKNFYWYYYFTTEDTKTPKINSNFNYQCVLSIDSLGNKNYRVKFLPNSSVVVAPGARFPSAASAADGEPCELYTDWSSWDTSNDYSHISSTSFVENKKNPVHLVSNDSLIYGTPPDFAAKPKVKFSASPTSGYDSLQVVFTDSSTGGISSRKWYFGDAKTDTITKNPIHNYSTTGVFNVALVLWGIGGKDSVSKSAYITVSVGKPKAKFSASPIIGVDSLTVHFYDTSSGNITSRLWDFGDSSTSAEKNPAHKYVSRGAFQVTLIVSGPGGADTSKLPDSIRITPPKPHAGFSASKYSGIDSLTVSFTDTSSGEITSRFWKFGNDKTSTEKNPTNYYGSVGTYTVKLYVTGLGGTDSASNTIKVSVAKPVADFSAANRVGNDSLTVQFLDASSGAISSWKWDFGDDSTSTAQNPVHRYYAIGTYRVTLVVTGAGESDTKIKENYIVVNSGIPKVHFVASPTTGFDSLNVQFYDSSTGFVSSWLWNFGDNQTSIDQNPIHRYTSIGNFPVTLIVSGKRGSDTSKQPITIVISPTKAHADFSAAPDSGAKPLSVQFTDLSSGTVSARVWDFGDKSTATEKNPTHVYATTGVYKVILAVSGAGGVDTMKKPDFITVVDSNAVTNKLRVSGQYANGDSAVLFIDSLSAIDTALMKSIGIWYGFVDSVDFDDSTAVKWFPAAVVKAASGRFPIPIKDSRLAGIIRSIYCSVIINGVNDIPSLHRDSSFIAGNGGILNPLVLTSMALSYSSIKLSWNRAAGFDSLRIWGGLTPVSLSTTSPGAGYDRFVIPITDTTITITGLFSQTTYYYGAQVYGNGAWSFITNKSSTQIATLHDPDTSRIANNSKIKKLTFDPATNSIKVVWTMDSSQNKDFATINYSIGISCTFNGYPTDTSVSKYMRPVRSLADSAVVNISETIMFDSVCYVSLWLKKKTGPWSAPTLASRDTIRITSYSWQKISFFKNIYDTIYAFNKRVRLWNNQAIPLISDTLFFWKPADSLTSGFIPVSMGFYFKMHELSPAFFIGLHYDSLPANRRIQDIHIFRFNSGGWSIENDSVVERAAGYIWVKTKNITDPFIAMIDTAIPWDSVASNPLVPVFAGQAVTDTFFVRDNVINAHCTFQYAKGGSDFDVNKRFQKDLKARSDTIIVTTPEEYVSEDNGLRAFFIINDGTTSDTVVVSRRVIRKQLSDMVTVNSMKWLPLRVTAFPDSQNAKNALRALSTNGIWKYDPAAFRLFRWYPYDGNAQQSNKWVEYSDSLSTIFKFIPGNLLWLKTKKDTLLEFGQATTPSLTENYEIILPATNWTDIALPYKFDIVLRDILDATQVSGGLADSLQFYHWNFDSLNQYFTSPIYIRGLANALADSSLANGDTILSSKDRTGYSIFNPLSQPLSLKIPPIPSSLSTVIAKVGKKSTSHEGQRGWTVKIIGHTKENEPLSPVYCGFSPGKKNIAMFPAPPSFNGTAIGVCDKHKNFFGHAIESGPMTSEGGVTFELAFQNISEPAKTIEFTMENGKQLPDGIRAMIGDPESGLFDSAQTIHSVAVPAGGRVYRNLIIGGKEYLAKMQLTLHPWHLDLLGAYPNPFGKIVRIKFSLPRQGVSRITIAILNLRGQIQYRQTIPCGGNYGVHEVLWNGKNLGNQKVASGLYIIKMNAFDENAGAVGTFEKRITYIP